MGRRAGFTLIVATVAVLMAGMAGPASARDRVHHCRFWSWTGPAGWNDVCSKQGITVSSPDGRRVIDWGFSGVICYPGGTLRQSAANFMADRRRGIKRNGVRFRRVGPIRLVGRNYFRQVNVVTARRGRRAVKGQMIFDYSLVNAYGGYCHQSSRAMTVPAGDYRRGIRQLKRIYRSMAYFGPGA